MSGAPRAVPESVLVTYEDYASIRDGRRYEVLDGELRMTPSPTTVHQAVSRNLQWVVENHVRANRLGNLFSAPLDVILARTTVVQPDLLFVRAGRESIITKRAIEGPPDLAVEIVSPSSTEVDEQVKKKLYARYGVEHYWIVDPDERTVEIYELDGGAYRQVGNEAAARVIRPRLFPGLEIALADVWF